MFKVIKCRLESLTEGGAEPISLDRSLENCDAVPAEQAGDLAEECKRIRTMLQNIKGEKHVAHGKLNGRKEPRTNIQFVAVSHPCRRVFIRFHSDAFISTCTQLRQQNAVRTADLDDSAGRRAVAVNQFKPVL